MNKTIPKNPVQRFKQGRKIQKAQFGDILNYATRYLNPLGSIAAAYDIYNNTPTVKRGLNWLYYGRDVDGKKIDTISNAISKLPVASKKSIRKGSTSNPSNQNPSRNNGSTIGDVIVTAPATYYATRKYRGKIPVNGLNSREAVKAYQRDVLGMTGKDLDGIWGDNTQAAWLKKESPGAKFLAGVTSTPEMDKEILNTPETIPSILNTPIQQNNITTSNPFGINGINFNMAQVDNIMKRNGIIPRRRFAKKGGTLIKNKKN